MSNLYNLLENTRALLRGYVIQQDQSTHLREAVSEDSLVWPVADASRLSPGRIESGSELGYVDQVDKANNTITLAPYGRGMDGSKAASHPALTQLTSNPQWAVYSVLSALNTTLAGLSGVLFSSESVEFVAEKRTVAYPLPAGAREILSVQISRRENIWHEMRQWRRDATTNIEVSGSEVSIITGLLPEGTRLQVFFTRDPQEFEITEGGVWPYPALSSVPGTSQGNTQPTTGDAGFTVATGLPESCSDVVSYGAAWRLLSAVGPGLLNSVSISSADLDKNVPGQAESQNASDQMYRMFRQRSQEERMKLLNTFTTPVNEARL